MSVLVAVLVCGLAGYRLTRLVVKDAILNRPRALLLRHAPAKVIEGTLCPWCVSAYLTAAVVALVVVWGSVELPVVVWLAAWGVAVVVFQLAELLAKLATDDE